MGKIKFKKPDIKGCFGKLKSLKWADVKNGIRAMKKRQTVFYNFFNILLI